MSPWLWLSMSRGTALCTSHTEMTQPCSLVRKICRYFPKEGILNMLALSRLQDIQALLHDSIITSTITFEVFWAPLTEWSLKAKQWTKYVDTRGRTLKDLEKSFPVSTGLWLNVPFFLVKVDLKSPIGVEVPLERYAFTAYPLTLISYQSSFHPEESLEDDSGCHAHRSREGRAGAPSLLRRAAALSSGWMQPPRLMRKDMHARKCFYKMQKAITRTDFTVRIFVIIDNRYPEVGQVKSWLIQWLKFSSSLQVLWCHLSPTILLNII